MDRRAVCSGLRAGPAMIEPLTVLPFPRGSALGERNALRKDLLNALRVSESPVVVDLTGRRTLDHDDVDLILECVAQAVGRDTELVFVAGSREIRMLLDIIRVSSLARVVNSLGEALESPPIAPPDSAEEFRKVSFELPRSA